MPISTTEDPDDENAMDETDLRQLAGVGATLDLNNADKDPSEEALLAEQAALTKEEEEFLKLEAAFISELNLAEQQLPSFAQKIEIKE